MAAASGPRLMQARPGSDRPRSRRGQPAFDVLGGYMFGTAAISFVGAASQFVIMVVLGIPLALPVLVLSFILCFIPYIGGFISTGIAFLLTVAVARPSTSLIMAIWTIVFNIVTGQHREPARVRPDRPPPPGDRARGHPGRGAVAGIMGMFIVVPALGVVAATWRRCSRSWPSTAGRRPSSVRSRSCSWRSRPDPPRPRVPGRRGSAISSCAQLLIALR